MLSIVLRWGRAVFRLSFSPIFASAGFKTKDIFVEQVVKACQNGLFCLIGWFLSPIFTFRNILSSDFSGVVYRLEGKILVLDKQNFDRHNLIKLESNAPPPGYLFIALRGSAFVSWKFLQNKGVLNSFLKPF